LKPNDTVKQFKKSLNFQINPSTTNGHIRAKQKPQFRTSKLIIYIYEPIGNLENSAMRN
jgi:hypothetical protein